MVQQQLLQQHVVQQPVQPAVQQLMQQPVVQQHAVQQPVQQLVMQQLVQPQMVPQPVVQQPPVQLTQPVVQQHVQLTPVTNQVMPSQNQILTQNQYQGILQVCNQGIPQPDQSQGLQPSENQVTLQCLNQGLQLESQDAEMQPVHNQGYLGMALALIKSNYQLPQSHQEDPGVPQQISEVKSSLCQPNADHSENQLDEGYQTDKLCGQHGTEVGGHEKPEYQGQDGNDNTRLIQVMSFQTVPVSDYEMLLMTEVPEQTWVPLLPSLPSTGKEDQPIRGFEVVDHMLIHSPGPEDIQRSVPPVAGDSLCPNSLADSGSQQIHGEVSTEHQTVLCSIGEIRQTDSLDSVFSLEAKQQIENHHSIDDVLFSAAGDLDQTSTTCWKPEVTQSTDIGPCQQGETIHESSSGTVPVNSHVVTSPEVIIEPSVVDQYHHDQGEVTFDFGTSPPASSVVTYNDMHQDLMSIDDTPPFPIGNVSSQIRKQIDVRVNILLVKSLHEDDPTSSAHAENMWCPIHKWRWCDWRRIVRQLHFACWKYLVTETKFKPPDIHNFNNGQHKCRWYWHGEVPWTALSHPEGGNHGNSRQKLDLLESETKFKPPDRCSSEIAVIGCSSLLVQRPKSVSLVDKTKFKPPGIVQEGDKWHWCDGVPWTLTHHSNRNPCQLYLEVETKYRPPDTTHHM